MAKEKKKLEGKDLDKKIAELKIELLKQTQKRKHIKKEIARALTQKNSKQLNKQTGGIN